LLLFCSLATLVAWNQAASQEPESVRIRPRICLVIPDVQFGQGINSEPDPGIPVRASLVNYLSGPAADVLQLKSRITLQIDAEATQAGCSHVVEMAVTFDPVGPGMRSLLGVVPSVASAVPMMGGMGGDMAASAVMSAAAQGMASMTDAMSEDDWDPDMSESGQIEKGDEIVLAYAIRRPGASKPIAGQEISRKAKLVGEDILSPLLKQTATDVLSAAVGSGH